MKEVQKDVKYQSKVVATIPVPEYDTVAEAVELLGEEKTLKCINKQVSADKMNVERAKHAPSRKGKKAKLQLAYALCAKDKNPEYFKKLTTLIGDYDGMQAFLESLIPEVEAAMEASATE
jgi:hypothetical protein